MASSTFLHRINERYRSIVSMMNIPLPLSVKSRMQGLDAHKYRSTGHCISEIVKNEGPMAFYKVCFEPAL